MCGPALKSNVADVAYDRRLAASVFTILDKVGLHRRQDLFRFCLCNVRQLSQCGRTHHSTKDTEEVKGLVLKKSLGCIFGE